VCVIYVHLQDLRLLISSYVNFLNVENGGDIAKR